MKNMKENLCKTEECTGKENNVKLCEGEGFDIMEEFVVNYSDLGEKVMIVDSGAPVSLVGSKWLHQYLEEFGLTVEEMESLACKEVFRFGPSKRYLSTLMVEIPLIVQRIDGKEDVLKVQTYIVAAEVPFLCGKRTLRFWKSKLDMEKNILEISVDGAKKEFRVIDTIGNHFGIVLEMNRGQNSSVFLWKIKRIY